MKKHFKKYIILSLLIISIIILSCFNIFAIGTYQDYSFNVVRLNSNSSSFIGRRMFSLYNVKLITINNTQYNVVNYSYLSLYSYIDYNSNYLSSIDLYGYDNNSQSNVLLLRLNNVDNDLNIYINDYNNNVYFNSSIGSTTTTNITSNFNYTSGTNVYLYYSDNNNYNKLSYKFNNNSSLSVNININYNIAPTSQPLTKTYDYPATFYNNGYIFDRIEVNGESSDTTTFDSIDNIKYINTTNNTSYTVYNGSWLNNFTSILYWGTIIPNVSSINSDCNNIVTFTTQQIYELTTTYNTGQFINNNTIYNQITVSGLSLNNSTFMNISNIKYNNDTVYENGSFLTGYSSTLYYNFDVPDITQLNIDCNSIVTFTTSYVNPSAEEKFFHDLLLSANGILDIVSNFANYLLTKIVLVVMCIAIPLVAFAITKFIQLYKIRKGG